MVRSTVYGHMVNTVICSLREKLEHTHACGQYFKAALVSDARVTHVLEREKHASLITKCRALEKA